MKRSSPASRMVDAAVERHHAELLRYLERLLLDVDAARGVLETTVERAHASAEHAPRKDPPQRLWLFRLATAVAAREWDPRPAWREGSLVDAARAAPAAFARSGAAPGLAERHLVFCLSFRLGQLPPRHAASLLLARGFGMTEGEIAEVVEARVAQVLNWIREADVSLGDLYARECGLLGAQAPCRQCLDLDRGERPAALRETARSVFARLERLARERDRPLDPFHLALVQALNAALPD